MPNQSIVIKLIVAVGDRIVPPANTAKLMFYY
jgi:hypothetical protein